MGRLLYVAGAASAIVSLVYLASCQDPFTGPYPCEVDYASCVNTEKNFCETNITMDAAHCGGCGIQCPVGGVCSNSECGPGAQQLVALPIGSIPFLAVNNTHVFWSTRSQNQISMLPTSGGTPRVLVSSVGGCGGMQLPFAVDQTNVYYWTDNMPCSGASICTNSGLAKIAFTDPNLLLTMLVPNTPTANLPCPSALAVDSRRLYWTGDQNGAFVVMDAPLAGGTAAKLAAEQNGGGGVVSIGLTPSVVVYSTFVPNGPLQIRAVPITGGDPKAISTELNGQTVGITAFSTDANNVYAVGSGCPCDEHGDSKGLPISIIMRFALDGSGGVILGQVSGGFSSMALDATDVYVATDTTVWRLPIAGGIASAVAGNLAAGAQPYLCNGSCSFQSNNTIAIAVDATSVYIADGSPNVNAILKVRK